jgi:hypothetical protein
LDDPEPATGLRATRVSTGDLGEVRGAFDPADHIADEGRLTGSVWTEKSDALPGLDNQIDSGEGRVVTVSVNETSHFENMFHLLPPWTPIMRNDRWDG